MSSQELYAKVLATKSFLQKEVVKNRTNSDPSALTFRQIAARLDMIHEAERVGVRNLGERQNRKLTRMINELEEIRNVNLN